MKIPQTHRKKALIIVDVQPAFINKREKYVETNIEKLLKAVFYDAYIEAVFHAEKGSVWDEETDWICPKDENMHSSFEIIELLRNKKNVLHVEKETKSVFKGKPSALEFLKKHGIEELHIVGYDINDCVLATADEAFDLGFFTYVIEECAESSEGKKYRDNALSVLRELQITNNSTAEKIEFQKIP